jgi:hypothetical protein
MKRVIFFTVLLAVFTASINSYGQELKPKKCADGKWGYVDKKTGTMVIPCKYDGVWDFYQGMAGVNLNGKWGFIDKTGKVVIPLKYDRVNTFSNGQANVKLNGEWIFTDISSAKHEIEAQETEMQQSAQSKSLTHIAVFSPYPLENKTFLPLRTKF